MLIDWLVGINKSETFIVSWIILEKHGAALLGRGWWKTWCGPAGQESYVWIMVEGLLRQWECNSTAVPRSCRQDTNIMHEGLQGYEHSGWPPMFWIHFEALTLEHPTVQTYINNTKLAGNPTNMFLSQDEARQWYGWVWSIFSEASQSERKNLHSNLFASLPRNRWWQLCPRGSVEEPDAIATQRLSAIQQAKRAQSARFCDMIPQDLKTCVTFLLSKS